MARRDTGSKRAVLGGPLPTSARNEGKLPPAWRLATLSAPPRTRVVTGRPRCDAKPAAGGAYRISRQQPYEAVMSKLS